LLGCVRVAMETWTAGWCFREAFLQYVVGSLKS